MLSQQTEDEADMRDKEGYITFKLPPGVLNDRQIRARAMDVSRYSFIKYCILGEFKNFK